MTAGIILVAVAAWTYWVHAASKNYGIRLGRQIQREVQNSIRESCERIDAQATEERARKRCLWLNEWAFGVRAATEDIVIDLRDERES